MRETFTEKRFAKTSAVVIMTAERILEEYAAKGFDLTLRQLYYQFVARGLIPNTQRDYKRLGSIINDARLAGLIDWEHIVDRTRHLNRLPSWDTPASVISSAASAYHRSRWADQDYYVEVWVEKDALVGVMARACEPLDIPYFSCRGYSSQSAMYRAANRLQDRQDEGKQVVILQFSDHDPSGIDMYRDIEDRLYVFAINDVEVRRIALTIDQVNKFSPPANPAKLADPRAESYIGRYGNTSWELDALEPEYLTALITKEASEMIDNVAWDKTAKKEKRERDILQKCAGRWDEVAKWLKK